MVVADSSVEQKIQEKEATQAAAREASMAYEYFGGRAVSINLNGSNANMLIDSNRIARSPWFDLSASSPIPSARELPAVEKLSPHPFRPNALASRRCSKSSSLMPQGSEVIEDDVFSLCQRADGCGG